MMTSLPLSELKEWPHWLDDVLAKSADRSEGGVAETLAQHTWLVLSRLADFARLRPDLPKQLGRPDLWHILFWSALLHDFGKAMTDFQNVLRGQPNDWIPHRHEVFSLAFVDWIADALTLEQEQWLVAAIVSHHRDADDILRSYARPADDEDDPLEKHFALLSLGVVDGLWRWLNECAGHWMAVLGFAALGAKPLVLKVRTAATRELSMNGAALTYKRLKLYEKFIESTKRNDAAFHVATIALRGHLVTADHSASAHVVALGHADFGCERVYVSRKLNPQKLFAHQREAGDLHGSALLTAPTGSGKTEAALLWASAQAQDGNCARLFYTLPYQASMNAMSLRLGETYNDDNADLPHVGLQHGRSLLSLYRMLMERGEKPQDAAKHTRQMRNLARLNYPSVRVFSPFQMLKGVYRLKGYESLLADYHGSAFIFDEIHAYETKRLALILKLIEHLRTYYNARFLVMSATFPTLIKDELKAALGSPHELVAAPDLFQAFQRHQLQLLDGELTASESLERIANVARSGKSVLVVCNTVRNAQSVFDALNGKLGGAVPTLLLHGRFNMRDRSDKEKQIREKTATNLQQHDPIVLVATQAVEVSLDIDLDTIFTEPAPLEALVQRFGRINRGRKQIGLALVNVYRQPRDGQKIYNERLVQRTLTILERENGKPVSEATIGAWLDEIYSGDVAQAWQQEFDIVARDFEDAILKTMRAFESSDQLEELFYKAFDGTEVLPSCFLAEYERLRETDPILANELLVPVSNRQLGAMKRNRKSWKEGFLDVVDVSYSKETGLNLNEIYQKSAGFVEEEW
jgi:CRISPR-associated endonuclease/helicase Cas3